MAKENEKFISPEKDLDQKEIEEKEKILRLAEVWSEEELNQHFRQPAEEMEGFDPEKELEEIKSQVRRAPIHERKRLKRELMAEFKTKFIDQRQGLAELVVKLEDYIRSNPDAPKDDLLKLISEKTPGYQLNQRQIERFQKAVETYCQKHRNIQNYVRYYQEKFKGNWQKEFFKDLYGQYPVGEIGLIVGPISIQWIYSQPEDGALILNISRERAMQIAGGMRDREVRLPGLENLINAINFQKVKGSLERGASVAQHEEFHTIHSLIFKSSPVYDINNQSMARLITAYHEQIGRHGGDEIKEGVYMLIRVLIKRISKGFEDAMKSEILARVKEGKKYRDAILAVGAGKNILLRYINNFFHREIFDKKDITTALIEAIKTNSPLFQSFNHGIAEKLVLEIPKIVQGEQEICTINILKALDALRDLVKVHPYDHSQNKLVALLSIEPLAKWPRLAKMFTEVEENK